MLPTTPEYDQCLINQNEVFPAAPLVTASFQQGSQRKCPTLYLKGNPEEETEIH